VYAGLVEGCADGAVAGDETGKLDAGAGPGTETGVPPSDSPSEDATGRAPSDRQAGAPVFPIRDWDRYRCLRFLGQGGMGQVFLARDPRLHRDVAIKLVRGDAPDAIRRLVAEARAQARVSHERVCKVYEVGEVDGQVYIAMQFIDGAPLGTLAPTLTVEETAMLFREAALGIHAAHQVGILHRDVKPSNILVERGADRALLPYVVDFGLARDGTAEGATETGSVLGTPHYMAPEQARGELRQLDRRADVYSLGASLYHVLTGEPPIVGSNRLEILTHIATQEPRSPRAGEPSIPVDLEAIVMKCLEKAPSARYDSARALAEDLDRFLAGEPVAARRAGLGYRLRKRLSRHRRLVVAGAVALVLLGTAVGWGVKGRLEAAARERLARRFTEQVEHIEATARYSALARLHDIRGDHKALRAEMAALDEEIRREGTNAEGPGHYALGRGYLALGDDDQAVAHLDRAWQHGFREPRVAYALALATGHVYQAKLREAERIEQKEAREAKRKEIEGRYRGPVLGYLRDSAGADVPSTEYVAALVAFYEGRLDEALGHLDEIGGGLAWFYEAPALRGEILRARAALHRQNGEGEQAVADLDTGRRAFAAAAAIGESDPAVHVALGELEYSALVFELYGAGKVEPVFDRGVRALGHALDVLPDHFSALVLRARLQRSLAEYRGNRGEDVTEVLTRATADAQRAIEVAPARPDAKLELGRVWRQWGELRERRSQDPGTQLGKAIEIANAIAPADRDYPFHVHLGLCFMIWADYQDSVGADAQQNRSRAIDAYRSAIRINDRQNDAWLNLGINYCRRAEQPRNRDADGDIGRALAALERGRALGPKHIVPYFYGGRLHVLRARRNQAAGGDPRPDLARAVATYRDGLTINARVPQLHSGIGTVLLDQARAAWDRGLDPFPFIDQARTSYEQALAVAPTFAIAHGKIGVAFSERAVFQRARGEDPAASVREAVAAFRRASERTPDDASTWAGLAMAHAVAAGYDLDRLRDPTASLAQARAAVDLALARTTKVKEVMLADGEVKAVQALWRARTGPGRTEDFATAAQSFAKALDLAPDDPGGRVQYGRLCRGWASWRKNRRQDPIPALRQGLDLAEQALAMRPGWPDALVLRASLLLDRADSTPRDEERRALAARAADDFRRALMANANLAAMWRGPATRAERLSATGR
jgi:serine/threonine-protein kinase